MEKTYKNTYQKIFAHVNLIKGNLYEKALMNKATKFLVEKYQNDEIFTKKVQTFSRIVSSVAVVSVIGAGVCFALSPDMAFALEENDIDTLDLSDDTSSLGTDVNNSVSTEEYTVESYVTESISTSDFVGDTVTVEDADIASESVNQEEGVEVLSFDAASTDVNDIQVVDGNVIVSDTPVVVEDTSDAEVANSTIVENTSYSEINNDNVQNSDTSDNNSYQNPVVDDGYNHASLQLYTSPDNNGVVIITPDDALSYDQLHEVFNNLQKDGYIPSDARFEDVEFRLSYDDTLDNWNLVELGDNNEYTYEKLDPDKTEVYKPYEPEPEPEPTPEPDPEPTPEPTPEPDPEPQPEPEPEPQPEPKPTPEPEQPHVIPEQPAGMLPPLGDNVSNYGIAALASAITGAALYANHKRQQIEFAGITSTISNSLDELRDLKDSLLAVISDYKEEVKSYTKIK